MFRLVFAWTAAALFAASLLYFLYAYLVVFGRPAHGGAVLAPALLDVMLFSAFALHHSVFARTGIKAAVRAVIPPALERATYTLVASVLFVVVCRWWVPVPGSLYQLPGAWRWLMWAVFMAGMVITLLSARRLDSLELAGVRQVLSPGRAGTRPVTLLTTGLYGLVRHPIYFGWILLVFGVADMTMTRFVFAAVSTVYLAAAIPFEERGLIETFGADYASYQQRVRWRMFPGLY